MPAEFQGKVVVVTGGSRGIGRSIAVGFAREGAQCVLAASSAANLAQAATTIVRAGGTEPMTVAADLRTPAGCEQVFAQVSDRLKCCDVLVNCAGATRAGDFLSLPDDSWLDGFALKFFGAVHKRFLTPWKATILVGVLVSISSALAPLKFLADLVSVGTLFAFVIVCGAVLILRHRSPETGHSRQDFAPVTTEQIPLRTRLT